MIAVVLTVLAFATRPATAASTPPALLCVRQAQTDLKACKTLARQTGDACTANYFGAIPPCFGGNAPCASTCITTQMTCQTSPRDQQTACATACDQQSKNAQAACKGLHGKAAEVCGLRVKLQSLKCKQKCARAALIPLQRCGLEFNACLKACAPQSGP